MVAEKALQAINNTASSQDFLDDIIDITCLILRDGEECRFIHKSVQEYFTACFIKRQPEEIAKKFYTRIFEKQNSHEWLRELEFLQEIDRYRCYKYFYLPAALEALQLTESDLKFKRRKISVKQSLEIGKNIEFGINLERKSLLVLRQTAENSRILNNCFISQDIVTLCFNLNYQDICEKLNDGQLKADRVTTDSRIASIPLHYVSISKLIQKNVIKDEIIDKLDMHMSKIFDRAKDMTDYLHQNERCDILEGLVK